MNTGFERVFKELRKKHNLKQGDIGDILQIDRSTIGKWEQGKSKPTADMLLVIAEYFNVSVDYLMGRQEIESNFTAFKRNEADLKLLHNFSRLNDLGKREANKRVKELTLISMYCNNSIPIAAHNDSAIDEKELKLMQEDIDEL